MLDVTIVIPTFRRPATLRRALSSCFTQGGVSPRSYEVLVVDNSPEGSASRLIAEMMDAAPVALRYFHEPRGGICHARNAGLDNARGACVAFLDDDEIASPNWLSHLLRTQRRHGADVVFAPVLAIPPDGLDEERRAFVTRFFTCSNEHPTGTPVGSSIVTPVWARRGKAYSTLASGNVLLAMASPVVRDTRFHPYYALNGGEDTFYFTQLVMRGAHMVWCAEATVTEEIPPSRLALGYIAKRAFRGGQGSGRVPMLLRPRRPLLTLWSMAIGGAQLLIYAPLCAAHYLTGSTDWRFHMQKSLLALGKMFWMVELKPRYGAEAAQQIGNPQSPPQSDSSLLGGERNSTIQDAPAPELSILIPFHGDDPLPLVLSVIGQTDVPRGTVELVLFDDGSPDPELAERVRRSIDDLAMPVRLISVGRNVGRAAARNALATAARGNWLLYLDADMRIQPGFISRHLQAARSGAFDAGYGGYTAETVADPSLALHARLARSSDVRDAAARTRTGATAFCTSNLLVRADLIRAIPFDEDFTGWGWEDVDWAVSAAKRFRLHHFDNPAHHIGWQSTEELLAKYRHASANFRRLLSKHAELRGLPGARAAIILNRIPGQRLLRGAWAGVARARLLPAWLRILALKLWRASWAAEAIRQ